MGLLISCRILGYGADTKDRRSLGSLNSTKFSVMVLRGESQRELFRALVGMHCTVVLFIYLINVVLYLFNYYFYYCYYYSRQVLIFFNARFYLGFKEAITNYRRKYL